jgi:hypothetical protein
VNTCHGAPTVAARSRLDRAQGSRARFAIHIDAPRQDLDKLPARSSFAAPIRKQFSFQQRQTRRAFELSRWRDGRCCMGSPRALLAV